MVAIDIGCDRTLLRCNIAPYIEHNQVSGQNLGPGHETSIGNFIILSFAAFIL